MKTTKDCWYTKILTNPPVGGFFHAVYVLWGPEKDQFKLNTGHITENPALREPTQSHFRISKVGEFSPRCVFSHLFEPDQTPSA